MIEWYGGSRPQDGRSLNEDAYLIGRDPIAHAVVCDGAGNAQRSAKRAIRFFEKLFKQATLDEIRNGDTWAKWIKLMDSHLLGFSESTFIGVALIENTLVGAYAGDSRAYLLDTNGHLRLLTDSMNKSRVGSGMAQAAPLSLTLQPRDILLLMSDGARTPLGSDYMLHRTIVRELPKHFSEVPLGILEAAGHAGRADDMTVVALRLTY